MTELSKTDIWRIVQAEGLASVLTEINIESIPNPLKSSTILENEIIRLRQLSINDSSRVYEIFTDRIASLLGRQSSFDTVEDVENMLSELLDLNSMGLHHTFIVESRKSKKVIGMTELRGFDLLNRTCVVGSWLGEHYWGKNFGFHARSLLIKYAFNNLDQIKIEAGIRSDNYRAINALLKLGFQIEGRLRNRVSDIGKRYDYWLLGLLRDDIQIESDS